MAELATLRLEPGSRPAQLDWGPLVTGETARRIGCDAAVTQVLVGADGELLHLGRRTRSVPPRMRRALDLRDRGCQGPGCTAITSWGDVSPAASCCMTHRPGCSPDGCSPRSALVRSHRPA